MIVLGKGRSVEQATCVEPDIIKAIVFTNGKMDVWTEPITNSVMKLTWYN